MRHNKEKTREKRSKKETAAEERQRTGCTFAISEKYGESLRLLCMQERQKKKKHTHTYDSSLALFHITGRKKEKSPLASIR